jgi:hypothetical protein
MLGGCPEDTLSDSPRFLLTSSLESVLQKTLDLLCRIVHTQYMWPIEYTPEYESWFTDQEEEGKIAINAKVILLSEFGPHLGRPYADTIRGSKYKNLKELRINHKNTVFRILFCFNKKRNCWLLVGGNKKGKNESDFYKKIIAQAEEMIGKYPEIMEGNDA